MTTTDDDAKHLDLLVTFHWVVGAMLALFSCMFIFHIGMGIAVIEGSFFKDAHGGGPPPFMGWFFVAMGVVAVTLGWSTAACIFVAARKLARRRHRMFCMVIAGIECTFMPFGTVLGVLTLIALSKDSVRHMFGESVAAGPA
jgi:hypothetical protein